MAVPFIPFPGLIIRATSSFFSSIMRKYYTRQKLASMVEINVSSDHSGMTVNCSELPYASAWIDITNLTPFHVIVHEIDVEFYMSGRVVGAVKTYEQNICPSCEERLFIRTDLNGKQVDYIKRHKSFDMPRLNIKMKLSCKISPFEIIDRDISIKNIEFINCNNFLKSKLFGFGHKKIK
jgi:hypothetical protein